ncbi:hypothetical protein ACOMHN_066627 [Nucella lapillus]
MGSAGPLCDHLVDVAPPVTWEPVVIRGASIRDRGAGLVVLVRGEQFTVYSATWCQQLGSAFTACLRPGLEAEGASHTAWSQTVGERAITQCSKSTSASAASQHHPVRQVNISQ